ncbi:hypothetical protein SAMN05444141_102634 [Pseudovibrio denitrificans]|uniref:Uncharacterized protein n=1 Tax=Pseudovibrio denitrificans TaxID=258256 RepID=A0A1I6ZVB1_9HYPH|nr:hypothetical protein [Pseudovibrio denitrificans]SFT66628.1 hypothetical protein SAMN05444141_102634 [Pseudovibrio denitrificans]
MIWKWAERRRQRLLDDAVKEQQVQVAGWVERTQEMTDETIDTLYRMMEKSDKSLEQVAASEEGRKLLFQFLLHRQWIAYNVELLRQVSAKAKKVRFSHYTEQIENRVAVSEMQILYRQLINEFLPFAGREIKKIQDYYNK